MITLEFVVEIANFLISMFLVFVTYFLFRDAYIKGYKVEYLYFLIAAVGFMLFDLIYILRFDIDVVSSIRYFVKSSFLSLILLVFLLKYHLLTDPQQVVRRKPRTIFKK